MSLPIDFTGLYCNDEDVLIKARGDYENLTSQSSRLAIGADGVFASGNRWQLASISNDFGAQGVPAGAVCKLTNAPGNAGENAKQFLVVVSAASSWLTLRRPGLAAGQGVPPGPAAGATGQTFDVRTCLGEITEATRRINQRFRIPDTNALQRPDDMRRFCVLLVLCDLYASETKAAANEDAWSRKAKELGAERDDLAAILDRTYGPVAQSRRPSAPLPIAPPDERDLNSRFF